VGHTALEPDIRNAKAILIGKQCEETALEIQEYMR
jgi:hypothetical protein